MGIFGKYRYHEPWESVDNDVAAHYGLPVHSLYVGKHDTVDEMDQVRYHKTAKFMSIRYKTDIYDATERMIAHYERELMSLHYRYHIRMDDGTELETYNQDDEIEISPLGWIVRMEGFCRNCTLFDAEDRVLAFIARKKWTMNTRYSIDIYAPEAEPLIVVITSIIQSMYETVTSDCGV